MSVQIIKPGEKSQTVDTHCLRISEIFANTIQGEGLTLGIPATFIRLAGCTLHCKFCDTKSIYKVGDYWTNQQIFIKLEQHCLIESLRTQHLIFTGGSPMLQQKKIFNFLQDFRVKYGFLPYVEIENEAVIQPDNDLVELVSLWNNSPKLNNSGNLLDKRFKPDVIKFMARDTRSIFKFVVTSEADMTEIFYIMSRCCIPFDNVYLMAEGSTRQEIAVHEQSVIKLCTKYGLKYSPREHINIWNNKQSV